MEDFSEEAIRKNCPHCAIGSQAYSFILEETDNFYIVCDANPIVEGHILVIPKKHISCVGAYSEELFKEFLKLNGKVSQFLIREYGSVSSFEHGIFGQTVFHSHTHYLPFKGKPTDIVPKNKISAISDLSELKKLLNRDGGYLFFSLGDTLMSVNVDLAMPRFFRDRFAIALKRPKRGNWKSMRKNELLLEEATKDCVLTKEKWEKYFTKNT